MPCFPPLTSTDYTPRDIKIFFKNSRFQTRGVYNRKEFRLSALKDHVQILKKVPFFAAFEDSLLYPLVKLMTEATYKEGNHIVKQGDVIDSIFIIVSGVAEVIKKSSYKNIQIKTLGSGDSIGLADGGFFSKTGLRTATVTALSDVHLLSLSITALDNFFKKYALNDEEILKTSELMLKMELIKRTTLFTDLAGLDIHTLAKEIELTEVLENTFIFRQGEFGDKCYLIYSGELEVIVQDDISQEMRVVAVLEPPMVFGETSLLTQSPRNASVKTKTVCQLLVIRREQLQNILEQHSDAAEYASYLVVMHSRPSHAKNISFYHRQTSDGEEITILKNHDEGSYYRLSKVGWYIWQLLDSNHTLQEISDALFEEFLLTSPEIVTELVTNLVVGKFVHIPLKAEARTVLENPALPLWQRSVSWISNLMDLDFRVARTDAFITKVYKKCGYIFYSRPIQLLLLACIFLGVYAFSVLIQPALANFKTASPWLIATYIPLTLFSIVLHEFAHALTTKAFGFEVQGFGFGWYWFGPVAFADTSDMWLGTRKQRIFVNAAGMYIDAVFAGFACIVGVLCVSAYPHLASVLWVFALFNYVGVFKNLDPTLSFDGYYILMDILDKPNLRSDAVVWLVEVFPKTWNSWSGLLKHKKELIYFVICLSFFVLSLLLTLFLQDNVMNVFFPHVTKTSFYSYFRWFLPFLTIIFFGMSIWVEINRQHIRSRTK